jgi:hypothetical protein
MDFTDEAAQIMALAGKWVKTRVKALKKAPKKNRLGIFAYPFSASSEGVSGSFAGNHE